MRDDAFDKLMEFLSNLEQGKIHYSLDHNRDHAIMIIVTVPGERWEVEFFGDGSVDVERFISDGEIHGETALNELFSQYSEPAHGTLSPALAFPIVDLPVLTQRLVERNDKVRVAA